MIVRMSVRLHDSCVIFSIHGRIGLVIRMYDSDLDDRPIFSIFDELQSHLESIVEREICCAASKCLREKANL